MNLTAPDGLSIVLMEKFDHLTKAVDCNGADGLLSLTFVNRQTYDYAISRWSYINEDNYARFLLITNHEGCGPADERQPYYIDSVEDDSYQQPVYLHAREAQWSDIIGTYDLSWGQATASQHHRLSRRNWWDDVKQGLEDAYQATADAVTDVIDKIDGAGNFEQTKAYSFPVIAGSGTARENIFSDPGGRLKLDCINCLVSGNFEVTAHIKVNAYQVQELSLSVAPTHFNAMLELEATITASTSPIALSAEDEIFSYPVPYAGISVPNVFKLGAVFNYAIGFNTTFKGRGVVDFGLNTAIPNGAVANLVIAGSTLSSATGFQGSILQPQIAVKSISASVNVAAYSKPAINFGIELDNIGKASAQLSLKLPEVSSSLTASYNTSGACPGDTTKQVFGVELSNQVKIGVDVSANAELGPLVPPGWGRELWSYVWPLPGNCWPITFSIDVTSL